MQRAKRADSKNYGPLAGLIAEWEEEAIARWEEYNR